MRLLIALPDKQMAGIIQEQMEMELWDVTVAHDGPDVLSAISDHFFDVLLLHHCLPGADGLTVGNWLASLRPLCPPRILFMQLDVSSVRPFWADCCICQGVAVRQLCVLLGQLVQKPLPNLAAAHTPRITGAVNAFLADLALSPCYKGHQYIRWLLEHMLPSPLWEQKPLSELYQGCACFFGTTAAAVERCIRVSVEHIFTQGNMLGIERYFGATVDPEKGKPTNRAFLMQSVALLRPQLAHSLADARSPKSSVMHHKPAAPTSV